jgi:putative GTP pyrophosphokinase
MSGFSKTQIDKLGDRLRADASADEDLRALDEYRRAFVAVHDEALRRLHEGGITGNFSGRAAKTTASIIQKLRRRQTRHVRLSQVQDICGLRIVVATVDEQNRLLQQLVNIFPGSSVDDRRGNPSHGYRAVHVIAPLSGLHAEIQIRTSLQHMWAQFCEHLADKLGVEVKYGGHPAAQRLLDTFSEVIRNFEEAEEGADMVRENPYSNTMAREEFLASFRGLMRFVVMRPDSNLKEADHVLPN